MRGTAKIKKCELCEYKVLVLARMFYREVTPLQTARGRIFGARSVVARSWVLTGEGATRRLPERAAECELRLAENDATRTRFLAAPLLLIFQYRHCFCTPQNLILSLLWVVDALSELSPTLSRPMSDLYCRMSMLYKYVHSQVYTNQPL
jgi:hypothetical protein